MVYTILLTLHYTLYIHLPTLNYRLGALGWMSMEDDLIPGNMGLKDQSVALKWIRENIEDFNGNSKQVSMIQQLKCIGVPKTSVYFLNHIIDIHVLLFQITLFGESAGGMSIMNHVVSPWSRGLFDQAIVQSGPFVPSPSVSPSEGPSYYGSTLVEAVGCDAAAASTAKMLKCLQSKTMEEIMDKSRMFERYLWIPNPWKPFVDGGYSSKPFLTETVKEALEAGRFEQVFKKVLKPANFQKPVQKEQWDG
jgi:carboxylesterase type B